MNTTTSTKKADEALPERDAKTGRFEKTTPKKAAPAKPKKAAPAKGKK
jgi:hypothetical protein